MILICKWLKSRTETRTYAGHHLISCHAIELGESLAETLRYIREFAAAREPGHPENRVTLDLFKLIRIRLQRRYYYYFGVQLFSQEWDKFEAWIDMGGCAKVGFVSYRRPRC